ncbi:MucR family transcriptional regulator [Phenylobacterium sp. LjRoot219]|uniref:MucR family transcriptional regulator n=1 Tax=Phenylobacterium sp. LjRoot219 TaxID=3342283 RepID=UPI003ECF34FE
MSEDNELRKIVADVAAAYFNNSHVIPTEISTVINQIATSLLAIGAPAPAAVPVVEEAADEGSQPKLTPSQIRKSLTRDAIISFEDGRPYKTLRRHLSVRGLTPDQYKDKWGLPKDYPMVAPAYSEARATMARSIGLGALGAANRSQSAAQATAAERVSEPKTTARAAPRQKAKPTAIRQSKAGGSAPARGRRAKKSDATGD